jgi:superfamily II DNA/RNA helicase
MWLVGRTDRTTESDNVIITFRELGVLPQICDALERAAITEPFPIQEMTLPVALSGADLIGQARTGTGKTLAFGIPVIQRTSPPHAPAKGALSSKPLSGKPLSGKPQALIVAPTRELALQVSQDLTLAAADSGHRVVTVYGGVGYDTQLATLRAGAEIVVGTPGRLIDLLNRGELDLSQISILVLDEADEMLDLGFLPDVEKLISLTPRSRQTMLFSATMPSAIVALSRQHLRQPVNIRAEAGDAGATVPETVQHIYQTHDLDKPEVLARIIQANTAQKVIVFTRTKRQAQLVADDLRERGFQARPLHGDMAQVARERAMSKFREDKLRVLVCTDVAARGIDVRGVSHVINYNCPEDDKTYVHRIGRTGRAGASGVAVTFVDWADITRWKVINKSLGLPFEQPIETYSTSAHLFADLDIDNSVRGMLVKPQATSSSEDAVARKRPRRQQSRSRQRVRTRTRAGQPLASAIDQGN